jgi:NTE family protein
VQTGRGQSGASGVFTPLRAIGRAPLFEGLTEAELGRVLAFARPREFGAGDVICRAGAREERMWLIVNGLAHVVAASPDGGDGPIVAKQRRGDVVGAMSLVTGEPHSATVVATIPTETLQIERADFDALAEANPRVMANMLRILAGRLRDANVRHAEVQQGRRGEPVALFVGQSLAGSLDDVLAATRSASPGTVELVDARTRLDRALADLDDLLSEHRTVLLVADLRQPTLPLLLDQADRAIALVTSDDEARLVAELASQPALEQHPVEVVLVASSDEARPRGLTRVRGAIPVTRHVTSGGGLPPRDLAWLGRHLSGTKLGVALGAGGARGYAEVGALQVLEEAGYTIDYISGSSIGAVVGSMVAFGASAVEIDLALREAFSEEAVAEIFKLSFSGKSTGLERMTTMLRELTDERTFADTLIPLTVMSVDLAGKQPAPHRDGPVWEALLAATALAGMFPPRESGGRRLVDGLALVPVPTGSVIEDGADVTVSVNLMSRDELPAWPGEEPPAPQEAKRSGARMLETIIEVMDLAQLDNSIRHAALADVVMTPRFGPNTWRDFHLADQFLAAGREEAQRLLPELRALARPQYAGITT